MRRGLGRDAVKQRLQAVGALANRLISLREFNAARRIRRPRPKALPSRHEGRAAGIEHVEDHL